MEAHRGDVGSKDKPKRVANYVVIGARDYRVYTTKYMASQILSTFFAVRAFPFPAPTSHTQGLVVRAHLAQELQVR